MRLGIFAKTFSRPTVEGVFDTVKEHGQELPPASVSDNDDRDQHGSHMHQIWTESQFIEMNR
jgi:hypothetical protein